MRCFYPTSATPKPDGIFGRIGVLQLIVVVHVTSSSPGAPAPAAAAAQQPHRFVSKADINFDASRHRVYEYTESAVRQDEGNDAASHCEGRGGYLGVSLVARPAMACLSCAQFRRPAVDHQDGRRYVGSPIIDKDGRAIGVVCTGSESENIKDYDGPHTHLMRSLPRWMTPLR